ncbi:MAG: polymer-forming cytoskeletal protein [Bdellovibrionales bacterium]|nr:polymer-forming cytoskeletal protein [Bdellovibrionales bacterium]
MNLNEKTFNSAQLPEYQMRFRESEISLISEGSHFEGTLELTAVARFHGTIKGKLKGKPGSLIVLGESGVVEGQIDADTVWLEGFVRGEVKAQTKVILTPSARVIGNLISPSIEIQPGAYFDGTSRMERR